jgi:hypothetical protein
MGDIELDHLKAVRDQMKAFLDAHPDFSLKTREVVMEAIARIEEAIRERSQ